MAYQGFARAAIARLDEVRLDAVELRIEAGLAQGRHREAVAELEQLVVQNPLRERPRASLMLALYRSGRQAEALTAYQETRRVLLDELGMDPSPALQDLERAILNQEARLDAPTAQHPPRLSPERSILVCCRADSQPDCDEGAGGTA